MIMGLKSPSNNIVIRYWKKTEPSEIFNFSSIDEETKQIIHSDDFEKILKFKTPKDAFDVLKKLLEYEEYTAKIYKINIARGYSYYFTEG